MSKTSLDPSESARLVAGDHGEPHRLLGPHAETRDGVAGTVVRAFHPDAVTAELLIQNVPAPMTPVGGGIFEAFVPDKTPPFGYRLRFQFADSETWERDDPYRFLPTLGEIDLFLFHEGTHRRLLEVLGAHVRTIDGVPGTAFSVWAPNATRVSLVGDFCRWDGRLYPMRRVGASGVFELFVPGVPAGAFYKFEIKTREGMLRLKSDPMARAMEVPPKNSSQVTASSYVWTDDAWMAERAMKDPAKSPLAAYEVHLGSWARVLEQGNRWMTYREIAAPLVEHVKKLGFTHVELMPIAEHPYTGSWGYQVSGYYAPTSRYGTPDDFRYFVDYCHRNEVGVIFDWVPAHFPKDDFALRRFDGTALYEHADPRQGEHPDWGTLIFNLGRPEVACFLIANAVYWMREFHLDGLRIDAVASMLYLDYSRKEGEWIPNKYGGRENLDAVEFLRHLHAVLRDEAPGTFTVAEESTSWPRVTRPAEEDGLGFTFKWNMGWMHDTLSYFQTDPIGRFHVHDKITFSMIYEYSERFINPLSHDEVVHGKGSLLNKMPGPPPMQFANLRTLYAYMWTRPGKKLLFMGSELAPWREWTEEQSLDWHLRAEPERAAVEKLVQDLGRLYGERPCLWRRDHEPEGFQWIDCQDRKNSVLAYVRRDGDDHLVVVLNLTPVAHEHYRIGAPLAGRYRLIVNTDDAVYGGTGFVTETELTTDSEPMHGFPQSLTLRLPGLSALVFEPIVKRKRAKRAPVVRESRVAATPKKKAAKRADLR
jgi:1,4-alpha-glucan branching enzyme